MTLLFLLASIWLGWLYWRQRPLATVDNLVKKYHKQYSNRIVTAITEFPIVENLIVSLESMEGLVNVADELGKPIVYAPPLGEDLPHTYYVLDGVTRYQFLLE